MTTYQMMSLLIQLSAVMIATFSIIVTIIFFLLKEK